jgi:hypothetical protein
MGADPSSTCPGPVTIAARMDPTGHDVVVPVAEVELTVATLDTLLHQRINASAGALSECRA